MKEVRIGKLRALCETEIEVWRAETFFTKEPGTIEWLKALKPGDILYDIGANIGLYSLYAASRGVDVYAFEPHLANTASLLRNVVLNGLERKIKVLNVALGAESGYSLFNLSAMASGSSGSQLYEAVDEHGRAFTPVIQQWQRVERLDSLMPVILRPDAIKIDVDGREPDILEGAALTLAEPDLLTVQVEMHPQTYTSTQAWLAGHGWHKAKSHWTSNGQRKCAQGADPLAIPHNVIFERVPVGVLA